MNDIIDTEIDNPAWSEGRTRRRPAHTRFMKNIVILISGGGSNMAAIVNTAKRDNWAGRFGARVAAGDAVIVNAERDIQITDEPEAIGLDILFEDRDVIVINKPPGLVVHPGAGNARGTRPLPRARSSIRRWPG